MTRITNADQILALLRTQLERAEKKRATSSKTTPSEGADAGPVERLRSATAANALPPDQFDRALIAALLTDQLGPAIANAPGFANLVEEVLTAIAADSGAKQLLLDARAQLRE